MIASTFADTPVTLERTHYRDVSNAWKFSNGVVTLVLTPDRGGRILFYGFVGDRNVLWEPPDLEAQTRRLGGWKNWGGDKSWPWPQDDWAAHTRTAWPPPAEFDQVVYTLRRVGDGVVEMSGPPLAGYSGRRIVRTIQLAPGGTGVRIETRLTAAGQAPVRPADRLSVTAWQITQTPRPDVCLVRCAAAAIKQTTTRPADQWPAEVADPTYAVLRPPTTPLQTKITADATVIANCTGDQMFIQQWLPAGPPEPSLVPDPARCQLYIDMAAAGADEHYMEMEWLGRPASVADQASALTVAWSLQRLPAARPGVAALVDLLEHTLAQEER